MKICPTCGGEMHDSDLFCTSCGQKYTAPEAVEETSTAAEEILNEAEQEAAETPAQEAQQETEVPALQEQEPAGETETAMMPEAAAETAPLIIGPDSEQQSTKQQDEKKAKGTPLYQTSGYAVKPQSDKDPVKMSEWMLNMVVLAIPIVNVIMAFVWAFGHEAKPSLKNFSRAWLIWALVLSVIVIAVCAVVGFNVYRNMTSYFIAPNQGGYYGYY